jgi:hypothetical protein
MAKRKAQPPKRGKGKATPKRRTQTVYQRAIKKFTKINDDLPEGLKISYKKRREIVSKNILKKFANKPKSKVKQSDIEKAIESQIRSQLFNNRVQEECNLVVAASAQPDWLRQNINYFEVESYIRERIPRCIYVKVSAGDYGETAIFFALDFNYYEPLPFISVREIVDNVRRFYSTKYDRAVFVPVVKLKPGAENDGEANSYYLDLVLVAEDSDGNEETGGSIEEIDYAPETPEQKKIFRKRVTKLNLSVKRRDARKTKKEKVKPRKKK